MVFQNYALYPHLRVAGNIGYGLRVAGMPKNERQAKVAEVARLLQIDHLLDRRPGTAFGWSETACRDRQGDCTGAAGLPF